MLYFHTLNLLILSSDSVKILNISIDFLKFQLYFQLRFLCVPFQNDIFLFVYIPFASVIYFKVQFYNNVQWNQKYRQENKSTVTQPVWLDHWLLAFLLSHFLPATSDTPRSVQKQSEMHWRLNSKQTPWRLLGAP